MAEVSRNSIKELIDLIRLSDPITLRDEMLTVLGGAVEGVPEIPKDRKDALKLLFSTMDKAEKNRIRADIKRGELGLAGRRLENTLQAITLRGEVQEQIIRTRGEVAAAQRERAVDAATQAALLKEELLPEVRMRAKLGAQAIEQAPRIKEQEALIQDIESRIVSNKAISPEAIRKSIDSISEELPGGKTAKVRLSNQLDARILKARSDSEQFLDRLKIVDPASRSIALEEVERRGLRLAPRRDAGLLRLVEQSQRVSQETALKLAEQGLEFQGGMLSRTRKPLLGSLVSGAGLQEGESILKQAQELLKTQPESARTLALRGIETAARGPARRLGKVGLIGAGVAALPLLARLFRGGGGQPQLPPLLQIQLMQQLAELQRQKDLTSSLVTSREAVAQRDLARANLLRLQAANQAGTALPAVV